MTIVSDLQALPLFQGIAGERLAELVGAFRRVKHPAGTVLFRPRDTASHFGARFRALLASGREELTAALTRAGVPAPDVASGLILGMFIAAVEGTLDGRFADRAACVDRLVAGTRALLKADADTKTVTG